MKKVISFILVLVMVLAFAGCENEAEEKYIYDNRLPVGSTELPFDLSIGSLKPNHGYYSEHYASPVNSDHNGTISISGTIQTSDQAENFSPKEIKIILHQVNDEYPWGEYTVVLNSNVAYVSYDFTGIGTSSSYFIQVINTTEADIDVNLKLK